jgi:hypothetical protein
MLKTLIIFFILTTSSTFSTEKKNCPATKLSWGKCSRSVLEFKNGTKKFINSDKKDETKKCIVETGYAEFVCINGVWQKTSTPSMCKTECTCCY